MVKIEILMQEGKLSKINELEIDRYINFLKISSEENLAHSKTVLDNFPRWAIISGYYAMHDKTKLLLAQQYNLKVDREVHATTIKVLRELIKNKELLDLIDKGYHEFLSLANDLSEAKKERVKAQYYTGSEFMKKEFEKRSIAFLNDIVVPYLEKIEVLIK